MLSSTRALQHNESTNWSDAGHVRWAYCTADVLDRKRCIDCTEATCASVIAAGACLCHRSIASLTPEPARACRHVIPNFCTYLYMFQTSWTPALQPTGLSPKCTCSLHQNCLPGTLRRAAAQSLQAMAAQRSPATKQCVGTRQPL